MHVIDLGWETFFEKHFEPYRKQGLLAMRIIRENRGNYMACGEQGDFIGKLSGTFRFEAGSNSKFPTVGDWVAASARPNEGKATILALLPRKSAFIRKVAGQMTEEQVVAANSDLVFIFCGLDLDFNLRRIERYLSLAWESGAVPVILLNKADLCPEAEAETRRNEVEVIASGIAVHTLSASQNIGLDILNKYIQIGKTAAFLGSSGVDR
jgi:ribosome biogenesis GTPase